MTDLDKEVLATKGVTTDLSERIRYSDIFERYSAMCNEADPSAVKTGPDCFRASMAKDLFIPMGGYLGKRISPSQERAERWLKSTGRGHLIGTVPFVGQAPYVPQ